MSKPKVPHPVHCNHCNFVFMTTSGNKGYCSPECKSKVKAARMRIERANTRQKLGLVAELHVNKICANPECKRHFILVRAKQTTCSQRCYNKLFVAPPTFSYKTIDRLITTSLGIPGEYRQTIGGV